MPSLDENKANALELSKSAATSIDESEVRHQEMSSKNENVQEKEISINSYDNNDAIKTEIIDGTNLKETQCNDIHITKENDVKDQEAIKEVNNELQNDSIKNENSKLDLSGVNENCNLELCNDIIANDLEPTQENNKVDFETIIKNEENLESLKENEMSTIQQDTGNQINDIKSSKETENGSIDLNISEEIQILGNAAKNSIQADNIQIKENSLVNGELSPVDNENFELDFDDTVKNQIAENGNDIEAQNNFNNLVDTDNNVDSINNGKLPLIINSETNDNVKEKLNGNVVNQDSISSSDSETIIVNESSLPLDMNGDNVNISEQKPIAQPISVITIQTCDAVDSDCSEAYLTPNELNDTPKKIIDKLNLNVNDSISIVNDGILSQLNPSTESKVEVETPSKKISETILEQKTNKTNIDNTEKINVVETCTETEVETKKEDITIVLEPHEEHIETNLEGTLYSL